MLFKLENVGKEFAGEWLFREISLQANFGEHIGLIGRNGVGKTTLFNLIEGSLDPDEGAIVRSNALQIGRVHQIAELSNERTVFQETNSVFSEVRRLQGKIRELEYRMTEEGASAEISKDYESLRLEFEFAGGYDHQAQTEKVLFGLGFSSEDLELTCGQLSGGQRSRLLLAKTLLKPSDLLLLDEPTNHLDLSGILWLVEFLSAFNGALIVISHDRYFLDEVTSRTWEIVGRSAHDYACSFTKSRQIKLEKSRQQRLEYERQQEWKRRTEEFIRRNIVGQKTKQAQARRKQLEKTEWLEPPVGDEATYPIRIPEADRGGAITFSIIEGRIGFSNSKGSKVLVQGVNLTVHRGERIAILGGNGTGKTTLLRTILGEHPLLDGELKWGVNNLPSYFSQENRFPNEDQSVFDVLAKLNPSKTDEELRSLAARFQFRKDDVFKEVGQLSGGERTRLALARLFSRAANVLFMDEPTNHLDIQSREALEAGLQEFDGTLVLTSHDLYFVGELADRLYLIEDGEWKQLERISELRDCLQKKESKSEKPESGSEPRQDKSVDKRGSESTLSKNEQMRLRKQIDSLESQIELLEEERSTLESRLQQESSDHVKFIELSNLYAGIEEDLKKLYEKWEELGRRLESATVSRPSADG